jgi:hypothetical protein
MMCMNDDIISTLCIIYLYNFVDQCYYLFALLFFLFPFESENGRVKSIKKIKGGHGQGFMLTLL